MKEEVGAIILAAGFSTRFGSIKLSAELSNGATIFEQTINRIRSVIPNYKVVTRPELVEQISPYETDLYIFKGAEKGMGASLAYGIKLANSWKACLICLADMPFIQADTYRIIANHLDENSIIIPIHAQKNGNPVGFGNKFFKELKSLSGDSGGRLIIQANKHAVVKHMIDDAAILYDIDTPEDLERLQSLIKQ